MQQILQFVDNLLKWQIVISATSYLLGVWDYYWYHFSYINHTQPGFLGSQQMLIGVTIGKIVCY